MVLAKRSQAKPTESAGRGRGSAADGEMSRAHSPAPARQRFESAVHPKPTRSSGERRQRLGAGHRDRRRRNAIARPLHALRPGVFGAGGQTGANRPRARAACGACAGRLPTGGRFGAGACLTWRRGFLGEGSRLPPRPTRAASCCAESARGRSHGLPSPRVFASLSCPIRSETRRPGGAKESAEVGARYGGPKPPRASWCANTLWELVFS